MLVYNGWDNLLCLALWLGIFGFWKIGIDMVFADEYVESWFGMKMTLKWFIWLILVWNGTWCVLNLEFLDISGWYAMVWCAMNLEDKIAWNQLEWTEMVEMKFGDVWSWCDTGWSLFLVLVYWLIMVLVLVCYWLIIVYAVLVTFPVLSHKVLNFNPGHDCKTLDFTLTRGIW